MKHMCNGRVPASNGFGTVPCSRAGVIEENGKWWCRQHAPSAVTAKREKRRAEDEYHARCMELERAVRNLKEKLTAIAELVAEEMQRTGTLDVTDRNATVLTATYDALVAARKALRDAEAAKP
jgi:hypothetical protein